MMRIASEFGFTPASRSRISTPTSNAPSLFDLVNDGTPERAILNDPIKFQKIWLLYDDRGILQGWLDHVDWLNKDLR